MECYKILAAWDQGVRTEEEVERQVSLESDALVVEESTEEKYMEEEEYTSKKRKAEK